MKILITGSRGFIGKHLVAFLEKNITELEIVHWDKADGDLSQIETGKQLMQIKGIDKIIHLASNNFVPESWEKTADYIIGNYTSTFNILEYCRHQRAELIYLSSYMYGNAQVIPIDEQAELKVNNPYGFSKLSGEYLCKFYYDTFQIPVLVLRPFNIFGVGQREDFLIPYLVEQITNPAKKIVEVNDINPRRDYLHVNDFCALLYKALINHKGFDVFNVGYGQSYSVAEVIEKISNIAGDKKEIHAKNIVRANEINDVVADISKASKILGWKPEMSFDEGLSQIVKFYQNQFGKS
jgi:nucleoside-diphosphate-sugar epimerase